MTIKDAQKDEIILLDNRGYNHTIRIFNIYCFFMASILRCMYIICLVIQ